MNKEFLTKISHILRMALLITMMVTLTFLCVIKLLQIQVVDADKYAEQAKETYTATQTIQAVRGRIIDSEGVILNSNKIVYKIILQRAFLPFGNENEVIAGVLDILIKHDHEWLDSLPITIEPPFQFKNVPSEELDRFKTGLGLNYDATVDNCIKALAENYKINTKKYDEQMLRYIGGVRYEMQIRDFSFENRYILAEDINIDLVIEIKEKMMLLKGVDIVDEPIRLYLDGTSLPHVRGRINAINEEQYAALKDSGYSLNDVIGYFGIEESMESTLRGENGIREMTRDSSWEIISDEITKPVQAGNTVMLTIDTKFQKTVEEILANQINWINQPGNNPRSPWTETKGGSIVVLDVTSGDVLAMANYPSYNIDDYVDIMLAEAAGDPPFENQPLLDRSAANGYRPGSSFKTVTATAGLLHGVIERHSTVFCTNRYTYYPDYPAGCTRGYEGYINVIRALEVSSNCFFYDVGRRLEIGRLSSTATELFGIGTNLDCDIYNYSGIMTNAKVYYELMGHEISGGDTIQAAIGQSETLLTPLHMATIAMTIANNGVRYRPHLVKSVWNYDGTELIHEIEPMIIEDMSEGNEAIFKAVQDGMHALAKQNLHLFQYLPQLPAYKTGTPEIINQKLYNSTVLGYYPFDNPKIAFAVVLEGGEFSTRAARNVIDAYFYNHYEPVKDENGNVRTYWEPWTQPFPEPIPGRYND